MYVVYICAFGRAGKGGGAPERAGTLGSSLCCCLSGAGFCRFGNGGGVAIGGTGGCGRLLPGGDGAVRVATFRLGLAEFDLFGLTSKS